MKKNLLTMLTAIMICGLTVTAISACSSDNDDKTETPQEPEVQLFYVVEVSDDVLNVADVEVNYVDEKGAKQKEVVTSKQWIKALDTKTLPLTEGLWAKITPKSGVASANYQLKVITVAGYEVKWADGKSIFDGYGSDPEAAPTAAQTPEEVAVWCAKSPTVAFTVSKEGYAKQTKVDFGGNDGDSSSHDNGLGSYLCAKIMKFLGYKEFNC